MSMFFFLFVCFLCLFCPRALPPTHYQSPFVWLTLKGCEQLSKLCEKSWSICICWIKLGFYKIIFSLTSWFHQSSICNEKYVFLALLFHFWRCRKNKKTQLTKKTFTAHFTFLRDINQKIFPILTVTDMSANQWSQFIKKDSGFAFLAYWNDMLVRNIILIILTFDVIIMAVNLSKIFCQECFESNVYIFCLQYALKDILVRWFLSLQ